jgi:Ca2+-binding RTX toxin-like protein
MAKKIGNGRNNKLNGGEGRDVLKGLEGKDFLYGRGGNDLMAGGLDDDTLDGGAGNDFLSGGDGFDFLKGGVGNDKLAGGFGDDKLYGGNGRDRLLGDEGNDRLYGDKGNDKLLGGEGDDYLNGGHGQDILTGGEGADVFVFTHATHSGVGKMGRDLITDFDVDADFINVTAIDAKTGSRNQDFDFLGRDAFTGTAGELRYRFWGSDEKAVTILEGDVNGDGKADFQIAMTGHVELTGAHIKGDLAL